jgi:hypothetical protein
VIAGHPGSRSADGQQGSGARFGRRDSRVFCRLRNQTRRRFVCTGSAKRILTSRRDWWRARFANGQGKRPRMIHNPFLPPPGLHEVCALLRNGGPSLLLPRAQWDAAASLASRHLLGPAVFPRFVRIAAGVDTLRRASDRCGGSSLPQGSRRRRSTKMPSPCWTSLSAPESR